MIKVNKKIEGDINICMNSNLRRFPRKELKEKLEKIEFKSQDEKLEKQKQMQRELEYLVFDIQLIHCLSITSKKDKNVEVFLSKISFGSKKPEIIIEENYILCNFLRNLMKSGN